MKENTLKEFKSRAKNFADLYDHLVELWNGKLKHGNNATYPVTIIICVILRNIAFDGSNCADYSHEKAISDINKNIEALRRINKYEGKVYMTHYAYNEIYSLFSGLLMSEDFE